MIPLFVVKLLESISCSKMKFPGRVSRRWIQLITIRQGNRTEGTEESYSPTYTVPHFGQIDSGISGRDIEPFTIYIPTVIKREHAECIA